MNEPTSHHNPTDPTGRPGSVSREELDRLFDREMPADERRRLSSRLRREPDRLDEVIDTRRAINSLRAPLKSPDLTDAVLGQVSKRRGFLSANLRRRVRTGRWAVAAMFVLSLGVVALAHRALPGRLDLTPGPTPVSDLSDAVRKDSLESQLRFRDAVAELGRADLVSDESARGSVATLVSPACLTAFHIEDDAQFASGDTATLGPALADDAQSIALFMARESLAAFHQPDGFGHGPIPALAVTGSNPFDASFARAEPATDLDPAYDIYPGTVPLSAGRSPASAFVGRYDPFRDQSLENRLRSISERAHDDGHPASPAPVHHRD